MKRLVLAFTVVATLALFSSCSESTPVQPDQNTDTTGTGLSISDLYDTAPDVGNCQTGSLKPAERTKVLNYVNAMRALHGLEPVTYRAADDPATAQASLIVAANQSLNHFPPESESCWSQSGYDASGTSNLAIRLFSRANDLHTSESFVDQWLKDSMVSELGHRRWLIDPFLKYISFGRVDKDAAGSNWGVSGSAIKVIYDEKQDLVGTSVEYVAYPYHDYPARLYGPNLDMSFSVLADPTDFWKNDQVDFGNATITIAADGGSNIDVSNITVDNQTYGLANCLSWRASVSSGTRYTVDIRNVKVNGEVKNYQYWFTLTPTA